MGFNSRRGSWWFRAMFAFTCACVVVGAQVNPGSPNQIIRYLNYQDGRPGLERRMIGIGGCGQASPDEDRNLALALAEAPGESLNAIKAYLDALAANPTQVPRWGAAYVMLAYAKIEGERGLAPLRRFLSTPGLEDLRYSTSASIALAMHFTSFVSSMAKPVRHFRCDGIDGPRESLDLFIAAWQSGSAETIPTVVDSNIAAKDRIVREVRQRRGRPRRCFDCGMAYRFETTQDWAGPPETLERDVPRSGPTARSIDVQTTFRTMAGTSCGEIRLSFVRNAEGRYLILAERLSGLLDLLERCTADDQR